MSSVLYSPIVLSASALPLDWLLDGDVPFDAELLSREIFNLIMTSSTPHGPGTTIVTSGIVPVVS